MPRLSDIQKSSLADWWTLVEAAGFGGYTTTDTITAASDLAQQAGRALSFGEAQSIATLYGYSRRMSNSAASLQAASPADAIDQSMMATPPWARDDQEMATTPVWHATFEFTYLNQAGDIQTDYRTSVFEMTLPDTVQGLIDAVTDDASAMADKYNTQLISAVPTMLLAV